MSTPAFPMPAASRPASIIDDVPEGLATGNDKVPKGHAKTECACGKDGKHYSETAMDKTFPSTPEKVYNLMFNSAWYKTFLEENQKLRGAC